MMKRPRHTTPVALYSLKRNMVTQLYEIEEDGIAYSMEIEETRLLKQYFKMRGAISIADWYSSLSKDERNKVQRQGHKLPGNDVYYDMGYQED